MFLLFFCLDTKEPKGQGCISFTDLLSEEQSQNISTKSYNR